MPRRLVVYGASNPGVLKLLSALNRDTPRWNVIGFVDDTPGSAGRDFFGYPIIGGRDVVPGLDPATTDFYNNVFGSMPARRKVAGVLDELGCQVTSLVSPDVDTALLSLGVGVTIEANATLDSYVSVGDHSCVKRNASVGHETTLGDFVFVGPGATICGRVTVRAGAYVGAGSVIRPRIVIGEDSTVGVGAVVVKDVPPGATVVGNPARALPAPAPPESTEG